ncbi:MAG: hypothetical protein K2I53_01640 [Lachnospiraceae bacterium]|nr:hypothetical protein [Lachnospiraceae bacterium]
MEKRIAITVFGCEPDETEALDKLSLEFGVTVTMVKDAVSESNARSAKRMGITVGTVAYSPYGILQGIAWEPYTTLQDTIRRKRIVRGCFSSVKGL